MMAIHKRLGNQKGFTLIELLVVVAILGILAGIAAPRVMDAINNARAKKAMADMTVIRDALERFYLDYAIFPPSLDYLQGNSTLGVTQYLEPNFNFKNSSGNIYFYAVLWNDTEVATTPNLSDYVLGDPGANPSLPGTWSDVIYSGSDQVCQGLYDATTHAGYFWGSQNATPIDPKTKTVQNVMTGAQVTFTGHLTLLNPATEPTGDCIKYSGQ